MKSNTTYLYLRPIHPSIDLSIYFYNHKLVASASLTELAAADPLLEKVVSSRSFWSICRKLSSWSCWFICGKMSSCSWSILGNSSLVKNWSEMMRKLWSQNLLLLRLSIVFFGQQRPPTKSQLESDEFGAKQTLGWIWSTNQPLNSAWYRSLGRDLPVPGVCFFLQWR